MEGLPLHSGSPPPSREKEVVEALAGLTESTIELTKEVGRLKKPGFIRRMSRRGFLLTLGAAVGAGTVLLWPEEQPQKFPQAANTKEKGGEHQRETYVQTLRTWLEEASKRWGGQFRVERIEPDGTVYLSIPGTIVAVESSRTLNVQSDPAGRLLYLKEGQQGYTTVTLEVQPQRQEARREVRFFGLQGGGREEYTWITPLDHLYGTKTDDGNVREFQINRERIDSKMEAEALMKTLSTPHRLALFQQIFWQYEGPDNLIDFLKQDAFKDYRLSFRKLQQRNFKGNCNDAAEMGCEVLSRHGYPMHLLSIYPKTLSDRLTEAWHQVAALPLKNTENKSGGIAIIDQGHLLYFAKPEDYAVVATFGSPPAEMALVPGEAGFVPWSKARTVFAKWAQHIGVHP